MITPRFSCSQTPDTVIIRIYTPAVRASDIETHVDDTLFSLHINPYFLRLSFPAPVVEDDASSTVYDPASGYLTVTLTKSTPGKDFKDLDVLTKLLAPPKSDGPPPQPTIEVISSQDAEPREQPSGNDDDEEELSLHQREVLEAAENDWHLPQHAQDAVDQPSISITTERRYGFLAAYTGYFRHVAHTENEVNELGSEIETLVPAERRQRRLAHENEKWDAEHYMADFVDDGYTQELIAYKPPPESPCSAELPNPVEFTEQENTAMLRLPRKEYLATPLQKHNLYLTLLTILFSYAYDVRTTQNDPTPESAWTICSLTPAFSALDPPPYGPASSSPLIFTPKDVEETLVPSFRRALAFPLYRSFALADKCLRDVSVILRHGVRATLRALLGAKGILEGHEVYYVYSKIWLEDFGRWVASDASEDTLRALGEILASITIDKRSLGWDLPALELAALNQGERVPDSDDESEPGQETATQLRPLSTHIRDNDNSDDEDDEEEEDVMSPTTSFSLSSTSTLSSASTSGSHSPVPDSASDSDSNSDSESESESVSLHLASSSRSSITEP